MPNSVLNAAVAEALDDMASKIQGRIRAGQDRDQGVLEVLRQEITATKVIRFEGDGYSAEWQAEAARRGLPNLKNTPEALQAWRDPSNRQMFRTYKVLSDAEMDSRHHIRLEQYVKQVDIEAKTLILMIRTQILPTCLRFQGQMAQDIGRLDRVSSRIGLNDATVDCQARQLRKLAEDASMLIERIEQLEALIHDMHGVGNLEAEASFSADRILPAMLSVREVADRLEGQVDQAQWPMPTYLDLLFRL